MIASTETWKTCKHCGHVVQNQTLDGITRWVHAGTGRTSCYRMFAEPKTS